MSKKKKKPPKYVTFFQTNDPTELGLIIDILEGKEISYQTFGSLTGASIGAGQQVITQRVSVLEQDLERAKQLLQELAASSQELDLPTLSNTVSRATAKHLPALPRYSHEIKNISPFSLGIWSALFTLLSGTVLLVLHALTQLSHSDQGALLFAQLLLYPIVGFLSGASTALLYNFFQPLIGGIRYNGIQPGQLLSKQFEEGQVFYIDREEKLQGPISTDELVKHAEEGKVNPSASVQIGDLVTRASQLPFLETALFRARHPDKDEK